MIRKTVPIPTPLTKPFLTPTAMADFKLILYLQSRKSQESNLAVEVNTQLLRLESYDKIFISLCISKLKDINLFFPKIIKVTSARKCNNS